MPHESKLIALIAIGFVLALSFRFLAARVRLPPLVGYLLAGIAIGPFTPGFVADTDLASELAEIGVILLMFGVGLHFSMATLLRVRAIALPGAVAQIAVATVIGAGLARWWAGSCLPGWCSASPCRSRAPSCCCARSSELAYLIRRAWTAPWWASWSWRSKMTDYALRSLGVSEERSKLVTQWLRNEELSRPER
jgi:hypothetical protein